MSREIFEVTKDRFHLQDPCCYILQGTWPKEAKMRAMLDGSEIKSEIQRLEVVSALERFKDPDLMRGERITAAVQLPESLEGLCRYAGQNILLVFHYSKKSGKTQRQTAVLYRRRKNSAGIFAYPWVGRGRSAGANSDFRRKQRKDSGRDSSYRTC